jgi:penicillin-binding protein 1A
MTNMLESVVKEGTGHRLSSFPVPRCREKPELQLMIKTYGFVGYTPHLVAAVWMGHDEPTGMSQSGRRTAAGPYVETDYDRSSSKTA